MNVFAFYNCQMEANEEQPNWVPLWKRSWEKHGWTPRLITARHARRSKFYSRLKDDRAFDTWLPFLALHSAGGGWFVPLNIINFSFPPPAKVIREVVRYPNEVFLAPKAALERMFRGGGYTRFHLPVRGLRSFPSPEEALKFDF